MKKHISLLFIALLHLSLPAQTSHSWMDRCKVFLASAMAAAYSSVIEMAARDLAAQGDIYAAELLQEIQQSKSPRQLACEAGTEYVGGIMSHMVQSLAVSSTVQTAIQKAIENAVYKVLNETISWSL